MSDAAYTEYEEMLVADCIEDGLDPDDVPLVRAFAQVLWTFTWSRHEDELGTFDVFVRDGVPHLRLSVLVIDIDDDPEKVKPLDVEAPMSRFTLPEEQIRHLVHAYLCYKADEQLWFDGKRPFRPHR